MGPEYQEASTFNQGYFIQDDFRLSNSVKVNVGLRYEVFSRAGRTVPTPACRNVGVFPSDTNNWAPRASLAWDPFGNGRDVIRARLRHLLQHDDAADLQQVPARQRPRRAQRQRDAGQPRRAGLHPRSGGADHRASTSSPTCASWLRSSRTSRSHEAFVTYDRELRREPALSVTYRNNRGRNLPVALRHEPDAGGHAAPTARRAGRTVNAAESRRSATSSSPTRSGTRTTTACVTVLTKRFSHGVSFQASYHWSNVEGRRSRTTSPGSGSSPRPRTRRTSAWTSGTGDFDMPHRFVLTGVIEPTSASLTGHAGAPAERLAVVAAHHRGEGLSVQRGHRSGRQRRHGLQRSPDWHRLQRASACPATTPSICGSRARFRLASDADAGADRRGLQSGEQLTPQGPTRSTGRRGTEA